MQIIEIVYLEYIKDKDKLFVKWEVEFKIKKKKWLDFLNSIQIQVDPNQQNASWKRNQFCQIETCVFALATILISRFNVCEC